MQAPAQPQGIDAILAALGTGGQPNGQIGKMAPPINAQTGITALDPTMQPPIAGAPQGMPPGMPQAGAVDPMAGAMGDVNPQMVQMIIQALMQGGAFNQQPAVV